MTRRLGIGRRGIRFGGSRITRPWDASGLILYLDAPPWGQITLREGLYVTGVTDLSDSGNDFAEVTEALQPTLLANGLIRFDQLDCLLATSDILQADGTTLMSMCSNRSADPEDYLAVMTTHSLVQYVNMATSHCYGTYNGNQVLSGVAIDTAMHVLTLVTRAYNDVDFYIDTTGPITLATGSSYNERATILGAIADVGTHGLNGDWGGTAMWNRALTTAEILQQVAGFKQRWPL